MIVSTRGRYALRVMIDLAEHNTGEYIPLMDIAKRQDISEKYLESIIGSMAKQGFLHSLRGKGGGYKLVKSPEEYTVASILNLTEGTLAPVACLEKEKNDCPKASDCRTLGMWTRLNHIIQEFFAGITIADLVSENSGGDYVI